MIKKKFKRVKVGEVVGNRFTAKEKEFQQKNNIWTPENDNMIVTNASPLSWTAFSRKLKAIDNRLFIHFWPNKPDKDAPFGHAIRVMDPSQDKGYDFVCGVGKASEVMIPAQTTFNHYFNEKSNIYESRIDSLGWVAAEEMVINFLLDRGKSEKV